jgi:hypothetical protein
MEDAEADANGILFGIVIQARFHIPTDGEILA